MMYLTRTAGIETFFIIVFFLIISDVSYPPLRESKHKRQSTGHLPVGCLLLFLRKEPL